MFRRTTFTTITPLPPTLSRDGIVAFLHDHLEMIDLNPLVKERHPIPPPPHAEPDEHTAVWYSLTDKISYLPGDLYTGDVTYTCAFRNVTDGLQTHCYAPAGLNIRESWTVVRGAEVGMCIREDVDMSCNMFLSAFVRRTLKKSHASLVERLKVRAQSGSGTTTAGMGDGGLSGSGVSPSSSAGGGEGVSTTSNDQGGTVPGLRVSTQPEDRRLRTPSPIPGGVSAEAMQYYRHWEAPSSPPPLPQKDLPPPPPKDTPVSDSQGRTQATPDPAHGPPPPPPKDGQATDSPNPATLPAKSHQPLATPQLLAPQRQDADQQATSGPGRSSSTTGLVPAPLRIRSRSPPQERMGNPPMGSPPLPSDAEAAADAAEPEKEGEQMVPEVKVVEDSPIGARLKGPFVAQLP